MIELGADINQASNTGELPLARNLACVTAETYDSDAAIFDMLIGAGCAIETQSTDDHPLLAICKVRSSIPRVVGNDYILSFLCMYLLLVCCLVGPAAEGE